MLIFCWGVLNLYSSDYWLTVFYFCSVFLGFANGGLVQWTKVFHLLQLFWLVWEKTHVRSSLYVLQNSTVKPASSQALIFRCFLFLNELYLFILFSFPPLLCWVFAAACRLSLVEVNGDCFSLWYAGIAARRLQQLLHTIPVVSTWRLTCPIACGIFLGQGLNLWPYIVRWILNHGPQGNPGCFSFYYRSIFPTSDWSVQISISYWFCLEMCLFLSACLNHWHITIHSIILWFFVSL